MVGLAIWHSRFDDGSVALSPMPSPSSAFLGLWCCALAAGLFACGSGDSSDKIPPPIILITLDTVRADSLGVYGGPEGATPVLDEFSRGADRYETCIASAPWTMPTHASLFTGLYPFEHGAHSFLPEPGVKVDNAYGLHDRLETLAEALAARGYRTGAMVANTVYLRDSMGLDQGFAAWDANRTHAHGVNQRGLQWLDDNVSGRRPTFLFLNYMDAHRPYATGRTGDRSKFKLDQLIRAVMTEGVPNPALAEEVQSLQQKAVTKLDEQLGKLFAGLKERDQFDRSLIIVTADHGEAFGEHGVVEHSKEVYEELVRVPLIVKLPGQTEGHVVSSRASSVHVAGIVAKALAGTDAESIASVFPRVPSRTGGDVLAMNYFSRNKDLMKFGERFRRARHAYYEGDLKLIVGSDGSLELYDLKSDPGETNNLAESSPEEAARLSEKLRKQLEGATAYQGERRGLLGLTREERKEHAALGYSGDDEEEDE